MDNIMSIVEKTPDWVWSIVVVYLVGVAVLTALRWYIGGEDGAVHVLIVAFFPITIPYIAISNSIRRLIRLAKKARARRLLKNLGINDIPTNSWDYDLPENKLRYYAMRFENASVCERNAYESGDSEQIAHASQEVKIAKRSFWQCHEAFTLLGYDLKKKFSDYSTI